MRIEPWIYTHKYPINTFRHDAPLGHARMAAISSDWYRKALGASLDRPQEGGAAATEKTKRRRRIPAQCGGRYSLWMASGDERTSKKFLEGIVQRRTG